MGFFRLRLRSSDMKLARSDEFLVGASEIPQDHQAAYWKAQQAIRDAGWNFQVRKGRIQHGRKFTMTARRTIYLSSEWRGYPTWKKAAILWHELVHVRQRQKWGDAKFLARYATPRGRWSIEVPAYRQSIRVYEKLSHGKFNATNYVEVKLKSFRKNYWLKRIHTTDYTRGTEAIWLLETG